MTHHFRPFAAVAISLAAVLASTTLAALPAQADDHLDDIRRTPPRAAAPAVAPATDQFIVGIKGGPGIASEAAATSEAAGKAAGKLGIAARNIKGTAAGGQVVKTSRALPAAEAAAFLASLRSSPGVAYAEPDIIMYPSSVAPNDPWYPAQWNLWEETAGIRAPQAWEINRGEGAVVAVVDTGITSHSELNSRVLPGYDMVSDVETARDGNGRDANPQDEGDWCVGENPFSSWHGTHVAGTIAAVGNNNNGIIGVAPEAKLLPVRAIGACGGYASDVADSIIWAAGGQVAGTPVNPNPARVINVSVGGEEPMCSVTQQNAINFAHKAGAAVVVAAGNSGEDAAGTSPANCQNVITVAAADRDGGRASYSNYGNAVDVTAPGGDTSNQGDIPNPYAEGILSTSNFGSAGPEQEAYALLEGTSMAAPHIAGVAALLMSEVGSTYTPDMVEKRLKATARPLIADCPEGCGAGLVDAAKAMALTGTDLPANTVLPPAVTFLDKDGTDQDTFTVPFAKGVEYVRAETVVPAGVHRGSGTVTVSARAMPGYSLAAGGTSQWTYTFASTSPPVAGSFIPVTPFRALDTRSTAAVAPDSAVSFQVGGRGEIPDKVSAVVFNLTVAEAKSYGFITAYASGSERPDASNLNFGEGQIVANSVTVPLGPDGTVTLYNRSSGNTHLLADISGYYLQGTPTAAGAFQPLAAKRFLDTRSSSAVGRDASMALRVAGVHGVPANVSAVVLNLTVAEAESHGYITAYPSGANRPNASNVNFGKGQIIPNFVTVPVGAEGQVMLYNRSDGATHLVADVFGYYLPGTPTAGGTFQPMVPTRFVDTRHGYPAEPDKVLAFQATGEHGIPAGATAVVFNLTVAEANSYGYITAYPTGGNRPNVSSLNFGAGQILANSVTVPIGAWGKVSLFNRSSAPNHLVADVAGYFLPG
ncbi:S8 family serine peptidase [Arthrobacter sp. S1_S22]|nr:S8 family serine peptidase [Arthrobacter sp. S1_S22]